MEALKQAREYPVIIDNVMGGTLCAASTGTRFEVRNPHDGQLLGTVARSGVDDAARAANRSPYGLTGCIHTTDFDRGIEFTRRIRAGVAVVNGGTFGSEPHMPFGGFRGSGNGTREPGTGALDVYSELKDIYLLTHPERLKGA